MDDYEKILVERVVLGEPDLPGTILRLPMVYGPRDRQHRLYEQIRRIDDGRPAIILEEGLAGWRWTRGYVEDMAAAVAVAVTDSRAAGRIYNVGEADALSMKEWVREIARIAGWTGEVIVVPKNELPEEMREQAHTEHDLVTDSSRIREELGYLEIVPREEAIARTIAWERANPPEGARDQSPDYAAEDALLARLKKGGG
jgi:nucleoside-diphosphate-sugar epimerase